LGFYWTAVILGHLNIGHRHILAAYPPLFILCGAAVFWLEGLPVFASVKNGGAGPSRVMGLVLCGLLLGLVAEMAHRFPNYLAYFNPLAGGPARAYRHLVDSSLDWGQDLSAVKPYLDRHRTDGPFYLAYFGTASPRYYSIHASLLYGFPGHDIVPDLHTVELPMAQSEAMFPDLRREYPEHGIIGTARSGEDKVAVLLLKTPAALRWSAGTYLISATMLQPVMYDLSGPMGSWNEHYEELYQKLYRSIKPLMSDDPETRLAGVQSHPLEELSSLLEQFERFRLARLTAYLRKREPDDNINFSILVYRLTGSDVAAALGGPPPELGRNIPQEIEAQMTATARQPK